MLEDHGHILTFGGRPTFEVFDQSGHRRPAMSPPAVRTGSDDVHAVDDPAQQVLVSDACGALGGMPAAKQECEPANIE
jgi:hypothetical protein